MFEKLDILIQDYIIQGIWKMEGKFPSKNTQQMCMIQAVKQMMNNNHLVRKERNVTSPLSVVICSPLMARVHTSAYFRVVK